MTRALSVFALVAALIGTGCNYASTLHLKDGSQVELEITGSDRGFLVGIHEKRGGLVKVLPSDISSIDYVGEEHVSYGTQIVIFAGGMAALGGYYLLKSDPDRLEGSMSFLWSSVSAAVGIPILVWGVVNRNEAQSLGGWQQAVQSVRVVPLILSDGENTHYGLGISGWL